MTTGAGWGAPEEPLDDDGGDSLGAELGDAVEADAGDDAPGESEMITLKGGEPA